MANNFTLKKGHDLGKLAAEHDSLLLDSFVDNGFLEILSNPVRTEFLMLGRTGSGKTALIKKIEADSENVSYIDPDNLSMNYLQSSTILNFLLILNVNLEIFFKNLWKHVLILEIVRIRYELDETDNAWKKLERFFQASLHPRQSKTMSMAKNYLETYGHDYWIHADEHIKKITSELEKSLKNDSELNAQLSQDSSSFLSSVIGKQTAGVSAKKTQSENQKDNQKVEVELRQRAQQIVSKHQIFELDSLITWLADHGFKKSQREYLIVIDDLDKNWMPDDNLYLVLIKTLIDTSSKLNGRLGDNVKIIVALREDIYHRVYNQNSQHDSQREKWRDVELKIQWERQDLITLIDRRLETLFKRKYTNQTAKFDSLMPSQKGKRNKKNKNVYPMDYILDRTLKRPRDLIDFMNHCIKQAGYSFANFSWKNIKDAEKNYSSERFKSLLEEWNNCFKCLQESTNIFKGYGAEFEYIDIKFDDIEAVLINYSEKCDFIKELTDLYIANENSDEIKHKIICNLLEMLRLVGILTAEEEGSSKSRPHVVKDISLHNAKKLKYRFHKMFWCHLGLSDFNSSSEKDES